VSYPVPRSAALGFVVEGPASGDIAPGRADHDATASCNPPLIRWVGARVTTGIEQPVLGTVEDVSLRITTVRATNGEVIITPNGRRP
jgi:hypothetical protein